MGKTRRERYAEAMVQAEKQYGNRLPEATQAAVANTIALSFIPDGVDQLDRIATALERIAQVMTKPDDEAEYMDSASTPPKQT